MAGVIRVEERALYETAWAYPPYAAMSPGERYVPMFLEMSGAVAGQTVLDAGCGAGKGALALSAAGLVPTLCDHVDARLEDVKDFRFFESCLWDDLRGGPYELGGKVDWVYCADVLEHVPLPFTMLVVSRLLAVARRGVFLSIATAPDDFGAWVGKRLHQSVQDFAVWREQLAELGRVTEARDLLVAGLYLVQPC